jgi:hypothetical protein
MSITRPEGVFIDREAEKLFRRKFQSGQDSIDEKVIQTMLKAFRRDVGYFIYLFWVPANPSL